MITFQKFFRKLPNYSYPTEIAKNFQYYYAGGRALFHITERCFKHLRQSIPPDIYITEVLEVGCANGRNLIPFKSFALYGIDIVPESQIKWFNLIQVNYRQITIQDLTEEIEKSDVDLSKLLIISSGTLMYISEEEQKRFFSVARQKGCKNFIFQEFPDSVRHGEQHFKLDKSLFIQKEYRKHCGPHDLTTYILLDIPNEKKQEIIAQNTSLSLGEFWHFIVILPKRLRRCFWIFAGKLVKIRNYLRTIIKMR